MHRRNGSDENYYSLYFKLDKAHLYRTDHRMSSSNVLKREQDPYIKHGIHLMRSICEIARKKYYLQIEQILF